MNKREALGSVESARNQAGCCVLTGADSITLAVGSEKHQRSTVFTSSLSSRFKSPIYGRSVHSRALHTISTKPTFSCLVLVHRRMLMRASERRRRRREKTLLLMFIFLGGSGFASLPSQPTATPTVNSPTRNRLNNLSPILNTPNCCSTNPSIFGSQTPHVTTGGEKKKSRLIHHINTR